MDKKTGYQSMLQIIGMGSCFPCNAPLLPQTDNSDAPLPMSLCEVIFWDFKGDTRFASSLVDSSFLTHSEKVA